MEIYELGGGVKHHRSEKICVDRPNYVASGKGGDDL